MAQIKRLWLFTETSGESFAGTHGRLRLDIHLQGEGKTSVDIGDPARDDFAQGKTSCQHVILPQDTTVDDTQIREICLQILTGHDAWLPKSIWIICESVAGERSLLTADPDWHRWFDSESRPGYSLTLLPRPQLAQADSER